VSDSSSSLIFLILFFSFPLISCLVSSSFFFHSASLVIRWLFKCSISLWSWLIELSLSPLIIFIASISASLAAIWWSFSSRIRFVSSSLEVFRLLTWFISFWSVSIKVSLSESTRMSSFILTSLAALWCLDSSSFCSHSVLLAICWLFKRSNSHWCWSFSFVMRSMSNSFDFTTSFKRSMLSRSSLMVCFDTSTSMSLIFNSFLSSRMIFHSVSLAAMRLFNVSTVCSKVVIFSRCTTSSSFDCFNSSVDCWKDVNWALRSVIWLSSCEMFSCLMFNWSSSFFRLPFLWFSSDSLSRSRT